MRRSSSTADTLRALTYCAAHRHRLVTLGELAEHPGLSKNPLMKVVNGATLANMTRGPSATSRTPVRPPTVRTLPAMVAAPALRQAARAGCPA